MFVLCFPLFHAFVFGSMLACLDLGLCHVLVCFPSVGLCVCTFDASLFVWLHPFPFVACLDINSRESTSS